MPPKSSADVASEAFTPDLVVASSPSSSGGAQAANVVMAVASAVARSIRDLFMGVPSGELEAALRSGGDRAAAHE